MRPRDDGPDVDDRTLLLLVALVTVSGSLVALIVQFVRSRRRDRD